MSASEKKRASLSCLCFVAAIFLALMQPMSAAAQGWGITHEHATTITWDRFKPIDESSAYDGSYSSGDAGVHSSSASNSYLYAPIGMGDLPSGVELKKVTMFYSDTTTATEANIQVELCRSYVDLDDGGDPDGDCFVTVAHTIDGNTGNQVLSSSNLAEDILYQGDVDSDSDVETISYYLRAYFGATNGSNKLREVRFLWQRQYSDPPGTPSFTDVNTWHPAYEPIEALAASGISVGYADGTYRPDTVVTRAQMAVFIAKALGLHFDATN